MEASGWSASLSVIVASSKPPRATPFVAVSRRIEKLTKPGSTYPSTLMGSTTMFFTRSSPVKLRTPFSGSTIL